MSKILHLQKLQQN